VATALLIADSILTFWIPWPRATMISGDALCAKYLMSCFSLKLMKSDFLSICFSTPV